MRLDTLGPRCHPPPRMSTFATRAWLPRRARIRPALKKGIFWIAFWLIVFLLAAFFALGIAIIPMLAAVPVALAVSWFLCSRFPVAAFASLIILSVGFWSIEQFTHLPTGPTADAILIGLWIGGVQALIWEDRPGVKR